MIRGEDSWGPASFGLVGMVGTYYGADSSLHNSAARLGELASVLGI